MPEIKLDASQFKFHFKLELDVQTNLENMQTTLEKIMENIRKEFDMVEDKTQVRVKPTLYVGE